MTDKMNATERLIAESRVEVDRARQRAQEAEARESDLQKQIDDRNELLVQATARIGELTHILAERNQTIDELARRLFNTSQKLKAKAAELKSLHESIAYTDDRNPKLIEANRTIETLSRRLLAEKHSIGYAPSLIERIFGRFF